MSQLPKYKEGQWVRVIGPGRLDNNDGSGFLVKHGFYQNKYQIDSLTRYKPRYKEPSYYLRRDRIIKTKHNKADEIVMVYESEITYEEG